MVGQEGGFLRRQSVGVEGQKGATSMKSVHFERVERWRRRMRDRWLKMAKAIRHTTVSRMTGGMSWAK